MKISNKHIVVTGGASGIGLELVKQLYPHNKISVISRPSSGLETFRQQFEDVNIVEADLADLKSVEKAADRLIKADDTIDILINNAAVQYIPEFLDDDFRLEYIQREIDVNFTSVCALIYLLLPVLLKSDPSTILNINSGLSITPKTSSAIYCATKGAVNILSQSLQYQLEDTNIDVKQAFLPLVATAMTEGRGRGKISAKRAASEMIKGLSKSSPVIDIGKVKLLRRIHRLSPSLSAMIMKRG